MSNVVKEINTLAGRSARIIISDKNWLEESAIEQFKKTMDLPGMCCGVGMPDLHPGKGQPIGAAFITKNTVYPHLVGSDIGCGMGLWQLDIPVNKIKLDKLEKRLTGLDDLWDGDATQYLIDNGIHFDNASIAAANNKLGTIGGGNHFVELQQVNKVYDDELFQLSGIKHRSLVLLVHSGSRGVGQKILQSYLERCGSQGIDTSSNTDDYLQAHNDAVKWAILNREIIVQRFSDRLRAKASPILDVTHNSVCPLTLQQAAAMGLTANEYDQYWIHRKGASPTDNGLVMIPGSRGALSYLVKPKRDATTSLAQGGFSLAHGAGRKWKRSDVRARLESNYSPSSLERTSLGSRVICKQRDLLYEEAPQAYKNIDQVVDDLVTANMIELVATFKPVLTYKTRKA